MNYFFLIFIILGFIGLITYQLNNQKKKSKLDKALKYRNSISKDQYLDYFTSKGFDKKITSFIYNEIINYLNNKNYNIHPEDDWIKLYHFEDFDCIEIIDLTTKNFGLRTVNQEDINALDLHVLNTLSALQLIRYIEDNPKITK